jgi:hypothetical protein
MHRRCASVGLALALAGAGVVVAACSSSSSGAPAQTSDDAASASDAGTPDDASVDHHEAATPDAEPDGSLDAEAGPDAVTDANVCPSPQVLRYPSPGCGADAVPVCGGSVEEACAMQVCGCDGKDIVTCNYSPVPWAHIGSCSDAADR